jgi:hypothetical protein
VVFILPKQRFKSGSSDDLQYSRRLRVVIHRVTHYGTTIAIEAAQRSKANF